jgi:site-specific DNA recombinase
MNWEYECYEDYASGKDLKRPKFQLMAEKLRLHEYDILLVSKIDRLSRSVLDFCTFSMQLVSWNIRLIVLDQGLDTDNSNPMSKMLIQVLAAFAEFEREMIRDRTRRGIANARAKGKYIGGQRVKGLDEIEDLLVTYHKHGRSSREISKLLWINYKVKVSNMTVYRRLVALGAIVPNQEPKKGGKAYADLLLS